MSFAFPCKGKVYFACLLMVSEFGEVPGVPRHIPRGPSSPSDPSVSPVSTSSILQNLLHLDEERHVVSPL